MNKLLLFLFFFIVYSGSIMCQTQNDTIFNFKSTTPVTIDGQANEECWANAQWNALDQVWIPYNTKMKDGDFAGRFKVSWDEDYLYVLVEVVDDSLSDDHINPLDNWWNDDCLEIFIDENRSKGDHERNCNAFAYHVSLSYDAVDLNSAGKGINYKNNIEVDMDTIAKNTYLWEFAFKNYDASFNPSNPENSRVKLTPNKYMGLAVAYCDNDETKSRENFIGSMFMTASRANDMYKNADHFGLMVLVDSENQSTKADQQTALSGIRIFPVPALDYLNITNSSTFNGESIVSIHTLTGQLVKTETFKNDIFINISDFDSGMYIVYVVNKEGAYSQRFLKQKN